MSAPVAPSPGRESARKVCARLQQAYRGFRLYPADHPTAHSTLEEFVEVLTSHLETHGPLMLRVEENRLVFEEEEVYHYDEVRSNLAFLMFRDGIRFLTFQPGIDESEAEVFVDGLAHADDLGGIEHDLTTAFWERELQHIEYVVVDPFLGGGGETLRDAALNDLRETVIRRLSELTPGSGGSGEGGTGEGGSGTGSGYDVEGQGSDGFDADAVALTQTDIEQGERAAAEPSDALADFALVLLEIAGVPSRSSTGDDTLARSLAMVTERFLEGGDVDSLGLVVDRLQSLEVEGRRPPEFGREVVGGVVTGERLTGMMGRISQASPGEAARIEELVGKMRDWIFPTLLEILADSSDKAVRKMVLDLLDLEDGVPAQHLWPMMEDPRWYVVRNAVQLATGSGDPELAGHLERLLRHPDARVRREVMRSLDTLGGSRSAALLVRALNDEDSSVRILAAHGLGRHGNRGHIASVQVHVESRDFETRPSEEIAAFLLAFAGLGGEATVDVLNKMWKRRVFGTRPLPLRLAAIQALGAVASPAAREALTAAARSRDAQLRRVAARALAEAQARIMGTST